MLSEPSTSIEVSEKYVNARGHSTTRRTRAKIASPVRSRLGGGLNNRRWVSVPITR